MWINNAKSKSFPCNAIPNKVYGKKKIIKYSSIPFQQNTPKHSMNRRLALNLCFHTRAKTSKFNEKMM